MSTHRIHFNSRRRERHDDHRRQVENRTALRDALRVVARGTRNDTFDVAQIHDAIVGAPDLKREHWLQILSFHVGVAVRYRRELCGVLQGGLDGGVVDAAVEDLP